MSIKYIERYFAVSDIYCAATIINELSSKSTINPYEKISLDISFLSLIFQSIEGLINTIGEICYPDKWELKDKRNTSWYKVNENSEILRKIKCIHDFLDIDSNDNHDYIDNVKKLYEQRNSFVHVKMYKYEETGLGNNLNNHSICAHLDSKEIHSIMEEIFKWAGDKDGVLNIVKNYARLLCTSCLNKKIHLDLSLKANLQIVSNTGELYSFTGFQTYDVS